MYLPRQSDCALCVGSEGCIANGAFLIISTIPQVLWPSSRKPGDELRAEHCPEVGHVDEERRFLAGFDIIEKVLGIGDI